MRLRYALLRSLPVLALAVLSLPAQVKIDSTTFGALEARAIGPAAMSGRIAAIDGKPRDGRIIYVGAAGGGLWKSTNGGTTFKPVFDKYNQSIGAIAVDPSNPETVWIGTGEPWVRNSVSVGSGIYKTTDGGENWQFMGLPNSERIAHIVVDPKNSKTVYVAVLGHLWDANEERGLYKTTDGGKTWNRILYVNPDTGCSDVAIDPQETQVLYAGMWQFHRWPWFFKSGGPDSGLYRSADAGKTWERLKEGLPEGELGRIAVAVSPGRPSTVWALVEAKKTALLRSDDMGRTWTSVSTSGSVTARPFYFSLIVPDPKDYKRLYKPGLYLSASNDGGKSFTMLGLALMSFSYHPDLHALWIDPANPGTLYLGTDGGVYKSLDAGVTWSFLRNLPVSQFYHVSYDMEVPYNVYGGLQDNGSWMGPSESSGGVQNKDWRSVGIGDGFYVFPHPTDKNVLYSQYQGGRLLRFHKKTGEIKSIMPQPAAGDPKLRFNWNAAVALSPSNPDTLYIGGQFLFRSRDRGESWEKISPDLTTNDPEKQKQQESGGLTIDNSSAENHCTIYAIAESPKDSNVIWVGTDDGNLQLTRDGGKTWKNLIANVQGVPKFTQVSSVEASRHSPGTAYVTFDGHMLGDSKTYVYKTSDFGVTWASIVTPDIKGYAHIVREDTVKPDLLFVGTEFGLFLTVDGGKQWAQFTGGLPNVAVRDLAIHRRDDALVIATHGRGIYVVDDITPIRQITQAVLDSKFTILNSKPSPVRLPSGAQVFGRNDEFVGPNPQEVAWITYYLKERHVIGEFNIEIYDSQSGLVTKLAAGTRRGINRVAWPMRMKPPRVATAATLEGSSLSGPSVPEGNYTAKLIKDGETFTAPIRLVADPASPHSEADRKLQQQTVMRLYRLIERIAFVSASVVEARDQARDRAKQARSTAGDKKPDTALAKELDAFSEELNKQAASIAAQKEESMVGISGETKLREMTGELYGEISRYGGRPTQSQLGRAGVLEQEVEKVSAAFESLLAKTLEPLNAKLKAANFAPITRLTKEEFDKRQR